MINRLCSKKLIDNQLCMVLKNYHKGRERKSLPCNILLQLTGMSTLNTPHSRNYSICHLHYYLIFQLLLLYQSEYQLRTVEQLPPLLGIVAMQSPWKSDRIPQPEPILSPVMGGVDVATFIIEYECCFSLTDTYQSAGVLIKTMLFKCLETMQITIHMLDGQ